MRRPIIIIIITTIKACLFLCCNVRPTADTRAAHLSFYPCVALFVALFLLPHHCGLPIISFEA
jgi:hypothetical protein